ncbi:MAG: ABC transporter family substrate-binding protein, partial [Mycobacteriaceae bacterium]|nr:ABC transporter family substrate-binding protein [Mycobacteriaceae bacterium]
MAVASCAANPPPPVPRTDSPKPSFTPTTKESVVVAVDGVGAGFNPHLLADQSPTLVAVSQLVLPSPFRPASDPARPGVTNWVPDSSVLVSAEVTTQQPFTVTYTLRDDAQWSDGAPIAAEDFRYLWQQMITQPGVIDPAGYRLIADISNSGGGKTVVVTMKSPYPAWRELFSDLLPSHLIKDSIGGFARALADNIPVSGSRFHIKGSVDRGRGEILLERNDRFWATPARPDQIRLRRGGTSSQLAESMRSGDTQVANVHGGGATRDELAAIPGVRTGIAQQPRELQLILNGRTAELAAPGVRQGVLALLNQQLLAVVAAGDTVPRYPAQALVLSPSDPAYRPTEPPRLGPDAGYRLLSDAGFRREQGPPLRLMRNGTQLRLRIGVPENDLNVVAVASTAADQLRGAGVNASVVTLPAAQLYGPALVGGSSATPQVDAVVTWMQAGSDPATVLASRFGCAPASPAASDPGAAHPTSPSAPSTAAPTT